MSRLVREAWQEECMTQFCVAARSRRCRLIVAAISGLAVGPVARAGVELSPVGESSGPKQVNASPATPEALAPSEPKTATAPAPEPLPVPSPPTTGHFSWPPIQINFTATAIHPRSASATHGSTDDARVTLNKPTVPRIALAQPLTSLVATDAFYAPAQTTGTTLSLAAPPDANFDRVFAAVENSRPEDLVLRLNGSEGFSAAGFLLDTPQTWTGFEEEGDRLRAGHSRSAERAADDGDDSTADAPNWSATLPAATSASQAADGASPATSSPTVNPRSVDVTTPQTLDDFSASFTGAGGGGGGAIGGGFVVPSPVIRSAPSAAPPFSSGTFARVSFSPTAKSTASFDAASPDTPSAPVAAAALSMSVSQSQLPPGIVKYVVADLNPTASGWATSRGAHISYGKSSGYVANSTSTTVHAALWNNMTASIVDLQPTSGTYKSSQLDDVSGGQQVGFATVSSSNFDHAMLWSGSAGNPVDLNPTGFDSSYAQATTGTQQVGYGFKTGSNLPHALLWNGSASNYVDLNPIGWVSSYALAASGTRQVGYGLTSTYGLHAVVWSGTASGTDIHPAGGAFQDSRATAVTASLIGGYGTDAVSGYVHAILWTSLTTVVDLNPAGFKDSQVNAINGTTEVGYGRLSTDTLGLTHAVLWTGSAGTYVDLNQYLPANYDSAEADGVDANGNVVGTAHDTVSGLYHAVVWSAQVPEPPALALMAAVGGFLLRRKRRDFAGA
jgi:hypothetical protein